MVKENHLNKRFKAEGKVIFYTFQVNAIEAKKAFERLEHEINKTLLTESTEVVRLNMKKVKVLPF